MYKEREKQEWATLKMEIKFFLEENGQRLRSFFINYPKKRRSAGRRRIRGVVKDFFWIRVEDF